MSEKLNEEVQKNIESVDIMHDQTLQSKRKNKKIAVIVQAVKLIPDEPGLSRAEYIASMLGKAGYEVDLITSTFQHWEKAQHRDINAENYADRPYKLVFIEEPGYKKNIDLKRIKSHKVFAQNVLNYLYKTDKQYDAIWCQIPPNNIAAAVSEYAAQHNIKFFVDVNDLWPEAMKMVLNVPVISDIMFSGFEKEARTTYHNASAIIGTSDEYANYPSKYMGNVYKRETIYVGGDVGTFDEGVHEFADEIEKPENEIWFTYAGTLGKSYDVQTLVAASALAMQTLKDDPYLINCDRQIKVKILGDGPNRAHLQQVASILHAPVEFLGYMDYKHMAAYLSKSDVLVNSLVKKAPQSIVSKISDYLAAGKVIINTGSSKELQDLMINGHCGTNIEAENIEELAETMIAFTLDDNLRRIRGNCARKLAVERFDRAIEYQRAVTFVDSFLIND